mmetsp:Transcript_9362/g.21081  ORF Transcript_9362/g.21081 Transcript_9362/m.21081 type:complete len:254 (-) Transcript_9362:646-1407(-)
MTGCCRSPHRMTCYRKGAFYAKCMPTNTCDKSDGWSCEVVSLPPPPPPPSPSPRPPPPPHKGIKTWISPPPPPGECGENFQSCIESKCCKSSHLFSCYERGPSFAMCLHKDKCRDRWSESEGTCKVLKPPVVSLNAEGRESDDGDSGAGLGLAVFFLLVGLGALGFGVWRFVGGGALPEDETAEEMDEFDDPTDNDLEDMAGDLEDPEPKKDKKKKKKTTGDVEDADVALNGESKKKKKSKKKVEAELSEMAE